MRLPISESDSLEKMLITITHLEKLDQAYKDYNRKSVDYLVRELRKIRRAIENGETASIEGTDTILRDFTSFYFWADERYSALEDDPKVEWIGMD